MKWNWKDYFIAAILGIISILAMFTIVDWTIEKDSSVGAGIALSFIGAILGGMISGLLTLLGVRLTIKEQRMSMTQEKIAYAKYFYQKIEEEINEMTENPLLYFLKDEKDAKRILDIFGKYEHILKETDIEFLEKINKIEKFLEGICKIKIGGIDKNAATRELVSNIASVFRSIQDYFKKYN